MFLQRNMIASLRQEAQKPHQQHQQLSARHKVVHDTVICEYKSYFLFCFGFSFSTLQLVLEA